MIFVALSHGFKNIQEQHAKAEGAGPHYLRPNPNVYVFCDLDATCVCMLINGTDVPALHTIIPCANPIKSQKSLNVYISLTANIAHNQCI